MRVVFDTNIFISAFIVPGSQGERAFLFARRRRFVRWATDFAEQVRKRYE